MADAAIEDFHGDVIRSQGAALEVKRGERGSGRRGGISGSFYRIRHDALLISRCDQRTVVVLGIRCAG